MSAPLALICLSLCCHLVVARAYPPKIIVYNQPLKASTNTTDNKLDPKPGTFLNCGDPSTKVSLSWTPSKLRLGDTAYFNFHIISPANFRKGTAIVQFFRKGQTDPFYYSRTLFNCLDIHTYLEFFPCPFNKGKTVDIKNYKRYIPPSTPIPMGEFYAKAQVFTMSKKELFCLYGHVVMLDD